VVVLEPEQVERVLVPAELGAERVSVWVPALVRAADRG
jgi:hypothetical protein